MWAIVRAISKGTILSECSVGLSVWTILSECSVGHSVWTILSERSLGRSQILCYFFGCFEARSHYVALPGLKLTRIGLPLPPKYRD